MRFSTIIAAIIAPIAVSAVQLTNTDFTLAAGQPFTITWSGDGTPVELTLKNGPSTNLNTISTISASASGTSYSFTPPSSLPAGPYAIQITQSSSSNYSPQFPIAGVSTAASSSAVVAPSSVVASPSSVSTIPASYIRSSPLATGTGAPYPNSNGTNSYATGSATGSSYPYATGSGGSSSLPFTGGAEKIGAGAFVGLVGLVGLAVL